MKIIEAIVAVLVVFVLPFIVLTAIKKKQPETHVSLGWLFPIAWLILFFMLTDYQAGKRNSFGITESGVRYFPNDLCRRIWRPMMLVDHWIAERSTLWLVKSESGRYNMEDAFKSNDWFEK